MRKIPVPREIMAEFKKLADGRKTVLERFLRGYRTVFRQRLAAGESARQIVASIKARYRDA